MPIDDLRQQRLDKLARIRARSIDPYPRRYRRTHSAGEAAGLLKKLEAGEPSEDRVTVAGRLIAHRPMGKLIFFDIRDGSGKLQLLLRRDPLGEDVMALVKDLDLGDHVGASGRIMRTRTGEPTVEVAELTLLSKSLLPLPEKWHGLADTDLRFRQRYLDLIANAEVKHIFEVRTGIIAAVRRFLDERGFLEVETPVMQASAGGALAHPFVTHHHALGMDLYLRIALELHLKRLIVGGYDRVYELGRAFRNEGIDATHNPEFTLLETYEAYADYNDVMVMVETMVHQVARQVLGTDQVKWGDDTIDLRPPWRRLDLRQAVKEQCGIDFELYPDRQSLAAAMEARNMPVDPARDRGRLIDELLSTCVQPRLVQPTFLVDYPIEMSPLAKTKPSDDRYVERFEGFAGGLELANSFTELNDPVEQRKRLVSQQDERQAGELEAGTIDEDFVTAMEHGMPPMGGLGVGIDRLVMLLTGQQSIREVVLFPQLKEKP